MNLMHIEIRNILGIKELEIEPGKINIISGHNAAGKTSVFEAIKTAIEGGNDATLINNDSDSGEIVLVFDNSYQLKRSLERGKTAKVKYTDANGINIPSPQSELNQLFDKIAINPVEFMHQKSKDRTETLLSALNIDIPVDEIKSKLNGSAEKVKFHPQLNGLPLIDNVYEQIFTERTVINRMLKQSQSHAVELSETLKSMDKTDAEELKSEYETLVANKEKLTEKIYDNEKDLTNQKITAIAAFEEEIYDKIEVLKKRLENFKSDVRSKINDRIQSFNSEIAKDREEL
ncbi:MAG: AAA family ATPase, partial [Candidatus Kapaibacterium sp.]